MPIDAGQAALIGAAVGAGATTLGALITSMVTRANSFRQHLYEKRLATYEQVWVAIGEWYPRDYSRHDDDVFIPLVARVNLHASLPVMAAFTRLREQADGIMERRADESIVEADEKLFTDRIQALQTRLAQESRQLPKLRLVRSLRDDLTERWRRREVLETLRQATS